MKNESQVAFKASAEVVAKLQEAGITPRVVGYRRDKLVVDAVEADQAVGPLLEQELRSLPGYEFGSCLAWKEGGSTIVQFFSSTGLGECTECRIDESGSMSWIQDDNGMTSQPVQPDDARLVRLAEKAVEMMATVEKLPADQKEVLPPSLPDQLIEGRVPGVGKVDLDVKFAQRLIAGGRLVVQANYTGTMPPPGEIEDRVGGSIRTRWRSHIAEITASPSGVVDVKYIHTVVDRDGGFRRLVRKEDPNPRYPSYKGTAEGAPEKIRNACLAAVEAARKARKDPAAALDVVEWEEPKEEVR